MPDAELTALWCTDYTRQGNIEMNHILERSNTLTDQKQGLMKRQGLTQVELAEVKRLAETCNAYEGLDLKLNWNILERRQPDQTNDFLAYEHGALVGFLPIYQFNSTEEEIIRSQSLS